MTTTFMVHDKRGNVWPPNFHSETCDPKSPHCMLPHNVRQSLVKANKAGEKARAEGRGWATGTIHSLQKPLIPQVKR